MAMMAAVFFVALGRSRRSSCWCLRMGFQTSHQRDALRHKTDLQVCSAVGGFAATEI